MEVRRVQWKGGKAAVPEVSPPALAIVDPPGVAAVRIAQPLGRARHQDQMHLFGHQAISPDRNPGFAAVLGHQLLIGLVVRIAETW